MMAKTVSDALRQLGVSVRSYSEADDAESTDGEVRLTDEACVQVGSDYLILVVEQVVDGEEVFEFGDERRTVRQVYEDIQRWRARQ